MCTYIFIYIGVLKMSLGQRATLDITPDFGYGAEAVGPIPANSHLKFDVELLAINDLKRKSKCTIL